MLRIEKDTRIRWLGLLAIVDWLLFLVVLVLVHYARPEVPYGILRYFDIEVRDTWLAEPKNITLLLLACCSVMSICGIIMAKWIKKTMHLAALSQWLLLFLAVSFSLVITF